MLTGWRMLLDSGRLQDGEPYLAGTARVPVARLSADTAAEIGVGEGDSITVATTRGEITLPLEITDMDDRVVWLPLNSPGSAVSTTGCGRGRRGLDRAGGTMTDLSAFGHDPIWLVLVKAVGIFVFLLLTVLAAILIERKVARPHADAVRPQPGRPEGTAAVAGRRPQARAEGRPDPGGRRQADLPAGADHLDGPRVHGLRRHPDGRRWCRCSVTRPRCSSPTSPVAVLYILAVTSIGVYGIVLAGWASGLHLSAARRAALVARR